jgi:NAD(P)-dependent dehydrogenase (short-subunit alcohol dehydrogenase family)
MTPRKQGLIVFISSAGGLRYLFNVAYGVGKAAVSLSCFSSIILNIKKLV